MTKKLTSTTVILITTSFIVGMFAGVGIGLKSSGGNSFKAGWEAAKRRLATSGNFALMPGGFEIKSVSGAVQKIQGNKIALKVPPLEALADISLDTRVVTVNGNTKIYSLEAKDQKTLQEEMEQYQKDLRVLAGKPVSTSTPAIMLPEMFIKKDASLSDIKAGMQITVSAGTNIKEAKTFEAVEITLQAQPVMPAISNPALPGATMPAPSSVVPQMPLPGSNP